MRLEVRVEGADLGLLVGPKGATLGAVQELARTVTSRAEGGGRGARVHVDVAGYRARLADVGYDLEHTLVVSVDLSPPRFDAAASDALLREASHRLGRLLP